MSSTRGSEILTLQFGHYSNFIGTHWWNSQDAGFDYSPDSVSDINHDVFFREGQNHRGEVTFTPRMLLLDLKGSIRHLSNDLYEDVKTNEDLLNSLSTWSKDKVEIIKTTKIDSDGGVKQSMEHQTANNSKDMNLNENESLWSDHIETRYHPKSINLLDEYQHGNTAQPFDCYLQGQNLWKSEAMVEEWTEKVRNYVEESDCLQGFQIISDATDGFSGLCSSALEFLKDEYSSKCCIVYPVIPPNKSDSHNLKLKNINSALFIASLSEFSNMFSPLSIVTDCWGKNETNVQFPHLNYNPNSFSESSSILATLLDTASLSYRLRGSANLRMNDLCSLLTPISRKAVTSSLQLPWPMQHEQSLLDCLEKWEGPLSVSLTPYSNMNNIALQNINLRGCDSRKLFPRNISSRDKSCNPAYNCASVRDMLQYFLSCESPRVQHHTYTSTQPIKTSSSFPLIFNKDVSSHGCIYPSSKQQKSTVNEIPVLSGLHCCQSSGTMLAALYEEVEKTNIKSIPSLLSLDRTEYNEALESLLSLIDNYNETDI